MSVPAQRGPNGRWLPGFAPNPSGRPAAVKEVRDLARQHTPSALARLVELMNSKNEATALAAIDQLLNRGYGKPVQAVESEVRTFDMGQLYLAAVQAVNSVPPAPPVDVTPPLLDHSVDEDGASETAT